MVHTLTMTVNQITEPQRAILVKQAPLTHQKSQLMEWSLPRCRKVPIMVVTLETKKDQRHKKFNKKLFPYTVLSVQDLVFLKIARLC